VQGGERSEIEESSQEVMYGASSVGVVVSEGASPLIASALLNRSVFACGEGAMGIRWAAVSDKHFCKYPIVNKSYQWFARDRAIEG